MTTMTREALVDFSGVVGAVLARYQQVLEEYLKQVTGDPQAVSTAATSLATQASTLDGSAQRVRDGAERVCASWHGNAADAYRRTAGTLADQLSEQAGALRAHSGVLTGHARALSTAHAQMTALISGFDARATQLTAMARSVPVSQLGALVQAAQQTGVQAQTQARQIWATLYAELGGAAGPEPDKGLVLYDGSTRWTTSGTRVLPDGQVLEGNAYFQIGPKLTADGEVKRTKLGTEYSGQIKANVLDTGASATLTDGIEKTTGSVRGTVDGIAKGSIGPDGLTGQLKAAAEAKAELTRTDHLGAVALEHKDEVKAAAEAEAHATLTDHKVDFGAKAGVTAEYTHTTSAEYGGVKLGLTGGVSTGAGGELSGTASYTDGHLKLGLTGGLTAEVGLKGGVALDIDVPKVAGELQHEWTELENSAASAGDWLRHATGW